MPTIEILTPENVREIVRQELYAFKQNDRLITHKEAIQLFQSHNLPAKKHGYVSLKNLIAQGVIRQNGSRLHKIDVMNYIKDYLKPKTL